MDEALIPYVESEHLQMTIEGGMTMVGGGMTMVGVGMMTEVGLVGHLVSGAQEEVAD